MKGFMVHEAVKEPIRDFVMFGAAATSTEKQFLLTKNLRSEFCQKFAFHQRQQV